MTPFDISLPWGLKLAGLRYGDRDENGNATGTPTIALHGWLDNAATFDGLAPLLTGVDFWSLDLSGHGHSDHRPPGAHYLIFDWVPEVVAVADKLGFAQFDLVGHSMGAVIATMVAACFPERVRRLALIEGLSPYTTEPDDAPKVLRQATLEHIDSTIRPRRVYPDIQTAITARQLPTHSSLLPSSAATLTARGTEPVDGGVVWRHDPRLRRNSAMRLTRDHVLAFLRRIECPTLLFIADRGWPVDESVFAPLIAAIANLQLERVPGSHHVHLDDPNVIAPALQKFLGS